MSKYSTDFEKLYLKKVLERVDEQLQSKLIKSIRTYFPPQFFYDTKEDKIFSKLILADYGKLSEVYEYIRSESIDIMKVECFDKSGKRITPYKEYYEKYSEVRDCSHNKQKMNVRIVYESGMLVCPYCNRDYISNRGNDAAGAQLDHFFNRAKFPCFSLCLYNLVPVCANCNHVKGAKNKRLLSPFDTSVEMDKQLTFEYLPGVPEEYEETCIKIKYSDKMKNNVSVLRLEKAYAIHNEDVRELIRKHDVYVKSQMDEICDIMKSSGVDISVEEIKEIVFGGEMKPDQYGKKPLSKLRSDILKSLRIYSADT